MDDFRSDRYELEVLLGEGNFGWVYRAVDKTNDTKVALKIEKHCKVSQLDIEVEVLQCLAGEKGFPLLIDHGKSFDKKFMAMSLLGHSLQKKMILMRKMISVDTVVDIGIQCLQRVKCLHDKFFLHRDLKPQQFMVDNDLNISLIDFGLCKRYLNSKMMIHIPYTDNRPFVGTINYASLNTHIGIQQSRRDDLESFCYILSYLIKGRLPWISPTKKFDEKEIKKLKASIVPSTLFQNPNLVQFFVYVKNLQFEKTPDYIYLFDLLNRAQKDEKNNSISRVSFESSSQNLSKNHTKPRKKKRKMTLKRSNLCRSLEDICISIEDNSQTEVCEQMPEIKNREIVAKKMLIAAENPIVQQKMNCFVF
jgi:serine/threonine protein kinase